MRTLSKIRAPPRSSLRMSVLLARDLRTNPAGDAARAPRSSEESLSYISTHTTISNYLNIYTNALCEQNATNFEPVACGYFFS